MVFSASAMFKNFYVKTLDIYSCSIVIFANEGGIIMDLLLTSTLAAFFATVWHVILWIIAIVLGVAIIGVAIIGVAIIGGFIYAMALGTNDDCTGSF
ncbi:MAG: hypothetical protein J1E99_07070 [Muribaculaceae bacterium]|nr:hypothetical protein [Muribaculaceae bacterium]